MKYYRMVLSIFSTNCGFTSEPNFSPSKFKMMGRSENPFLQGANQNGLKRPVLLWSCHGGLQCLACLALNSVAALLPTHLGPLCSFLLGHWIWPQNQNNAYLSAFLTWFTLRFCSLKTVVGVSSS